MPRFVLERVFSNELDYIQYSTDIGSLERYATLYDFARGFSTEKDYDETELCSTPPLPAERNPAYYIGR